MLRRSNMERLLRSCHEEEVAFLFFFSFLCESGEQWMGQLTCFDDGFGLWPKFNLLFPNLNCNLVFCYTFHQKIRYLIILG
ncbi:unnamed protein product [Cuscuta campestris]|uniref:Uncharacterized protein n=1 Tax=Cuscuta campestris TaxID=132261 RepID=A0A484KPW4_9ASTE|nr:unnamed protein product [Cuscuta campestris]